MLAAAPEVIDRGAVEVSARERPAHCAESIERGIVERDHERSIGGAAVGVGHAQPPLLFLAGREGGAEGGPLQAQALVGRGFQQVYAERMQLAVAHQRKPHFAAFAPLRLIRKVEAEQSIGEGDASAFHEPAVAEHVVKEGGILAGRTYEHQRAVAGGGGAHIVPQRPVGHRRAHIMLGENREAHGVGILTHGEGGGISAGRQSCQLRRAERLAGGKSALKDSRPVLEDGIHALAAKFGAGRIRAMHEHRARHFFANRLRPLGREPRAAAGGAQR